MLKGSAQLRSGDISGDAEAQDWFSWREDSPEVSEEPFHPCPRGLDTEQSNGDRGAEHTVQ